MLRPSLIVVVGFYLVSSVVMLSPICNFRELGTASYEGDARLIIWTLAWDNHALLDGFSSLFDANIFYPAPNSLAYSEHLFGISLFTLPVYALTRNPVLGYNLVWIFSYLLSALAAHALAWRYTRDHLAATVGGLAYAFCFFRMHHGHGHLHMIWAFWIPLSLLALDRWHSRPTSGRMAILVVIVLLQALASWYQAVIVLVADGLGLAWLALVRPLPWSVEERGRIARQLLVGIVVGFAILWPFASHYHVLPPGTPREAAVGAADLAGYLIPPENTWPGQWLIANGFKGPRSIWGERTLYLGWVTLILAAGGTYAAIRRRGSAAVGFGFFIVLGLLGLALAMGPSASEVATNTWGWSPFGLLAKIPGVNLFRVPARFTELVTLALAILAAAGCAGLHGRFHAGGRLTTIFLIPVLLSESYVVKFPGGPPRPFPVPDVYEHVASLPAGAVLSLPDFAQTPLWFREADYQYFSTSHWHPIANGYSRAVPPGFGQAMDQMQTFPSVAAADTMRRRGIEYVIVHTAEYREAASELIARLRASQDFAVLARFGSDYVLRVVTARGPASPGT